MFAKSTKTTETYILPKEFEEYTEKGFIIFMTQPTAFGTYRAVKIEVLNNQENCKSAEVYTPDPCKNSTNKFTRFWSNFHQQYFSI